VSKQGLAAACGLVLVLGACTPAREGGQGEAGDARASAARVLWTGNYESGDFSQWEGVLREAESPGTAEIVGKPVAEGRYAARFVLGPQTSFSGSRIEAHQGSVATSGGVYGSETWYRWAELVPSGASFARHASFNHLVQWLPTVSCFGSALSVNGLANPPRLLFNVRGGDVVRYGGSCDFRYERVFDLGPLPRDRWLRFRLHIKWHADPNVGFVELWMNGGRKIRRTFVATAPPDVDHYVRQGIYRFRCACRTVAFGDAMTIKQVVP
jgi:Polysaccharide lyase